MARSLLGLSLFLKRKTNLLLSPGQLSHGIIYGANVIGLSYFLKHSFLLKQYREYIECQGAYGTNEPADDMNNMMNDIISNDLKDLASENTPISLYLTPGMETTHLGTIGTMSGGLVGIPVFYEFKKEDVRDNILVRSVNYASNDEEKELSDCFLLSDKAKKYGIAREILLINTLQVHMNAVLPFAVSIIVLFLYKELVKTYLILNKPLHTRVLIYTALLMAGLNFWRFLYKNLLHYYESHVESIITELGKDYLEGGIEYCIKELKRNSLPVEIKDEKLRFFKAMEDAICKLLPSGTPVSKRLEYLKAHYEEKIKNEMQ